MSEFPDGGALFGWHHLRQRRARSATRTKLLREVVGNESFSGKGTKAPPARRFLAPNPVPDRHQRAEGHCHCRDGALVGGGIIVIVGIVLIIVWSFWIGLIIALVGLVFFGGFARGRWY
jgi:hypothetical protein